MGIALSAGLAVALTACGSSGGGSPTTAPDGGDTASGIAGKRISYISFGQQYEFIVGLTTTIESRLKEAGAQVTTLDGKSDPNLQTTQVQDALAQQPDALIIDPVDPSLMTAAIQSANAQGVPVFIVESLPDGVDYASFVGYDNVAAGELGADTLAKFIGEQGTVLQLQGGVASKQAGERKEGFDKAIAKYPNITVRDLKTEWTAENANSMTLDAFTSDPDIVGIWSHNDEMIRGAVAALDQLGKNAKSGESGHVFIVGHDGTPLALQRIRDGIQDATVVYDAIEMGNLTADNMIAFFSGKSFPKDTIIKPFIANAANVDDASLWGNLPALN
ncbi:MAG: hypothetical protein BGO95_00695 [Micrococcales bacterium 73-13]|nr:MAG: hypothetical protein BGO95_00695 [Micrococcales bacterium 73-13]